MNLAALRRRAPHWLALPLLLAGCALQPPAADREQLGNFSVDGRFALKSLDSEGRPQSAGGRLSWTHIDDRDRVLLANPLGIGLAEIDIRPGAASLRSADGNTYQDTDADRLVADLTGQPLPVSRLPSWLLGRPGPAGRLERDPLARPLRLDEAGWQIDYAYDDDTPGATPGRLTASRPPVELRLRLENWKHLP